VEEHENIPRIENNFELAGLFDGSSEGYNAKCCLNCPNLKNDEPDPVILFLNMGF